MEFFNPNSKVDFMGARRWTAMFSILIFVAFNWRSGNSWVEVGT